MLEISASLSLYRGNLFNIRSKIKPRIFALYYPQHNTTVAVSLLKNNPTFYLTRSVYLQKCQLWQMLSNISRRFPMATNLCESHANSWFTSFFLFLSIVESFESHYISEEIDENVKIVYLERLILTWATIRNKSCSDL